MLLISGREGRLFSTKSELLDRKSFLFEFRLDFGVVVSRFYKD